MWGRQGAAPAEGRLPPLLPRPAGADLQGDLPVVRLPNLVSIIVDSCSYAERINQSYLTENNQNGYIP